MSLRAVLPSEEKATIDAHAAHELLAAEISWCIVRQRTTFQRYLRTNMLRKRGKNVSKQSKVNDNTTRQIDRHAVVFKKTARQISNTLKLNLSACRAQHILSSVPYVYLCVIYEAAS